MKGTRATSGSEARRFRKCTISSFVSNKPSSKFISIICAPSSTCFRAMPMASSYFFSETSRKNLREPATLQRSPIFVKFRSGLISQDSKPESHRQEGTATGRWGVRPSSNFGYSAINLSVVPQHPPTIFIRFSSRNSATSEAMCSGVSSYSPKELGNPALGYTEM